ncbi:MAG: hypothetical protein ACD_30C00005G0016 [uncultured bacterium]|uniref:2 3 cyclic phosphodiesterase n=4 Tax=Candidatus Daviesiibacteriota TaxID=1752718 RepID=A0A0G0EKC3_9BACT|nr:MAG: hypothetical protein ACD_30C00005G0016 [uncultured bacterium]KKQ07488.1 MAG: 2 3 cyclic phosphodiesterase [Candidatus Daviesbacteria bacterium GW2011_GWB1_36_5]KKQ14892.1 MAG: 2 3 cyclic phosphodiesterase [Candidatus Daviesbacteria bacterium GW2011_GWA1_36_8]OGE16643.1 MAG: hypothetical protein A2858_02255 [Candidatus Daviesbacteria bacterium RIFCSPHIGHO2_01_FULL_36_37]OGE33374.1 MAG: hypothetical protein A3C99_01645 [Candidatus Daviesbacteria bacterium RIFCSPHIGHO2_02_FULL_37_9]OGE347
MNSFSIWIVPSGDVKKKLEGVILDLSQKYNSPVFEPHMTLLGDISVDEKSVLEKAKILTSKIKPFTVELGEISFSTTYFQSVFVRIKSNAELMNANLAAKEIFGVDNNVFMPHISLLYGDYDMELREKVAKEIKLPSNLSFNVDKLVIIPSFPEPKDWKHLAKLPL